MKARRIDDIDFAFLAKYVQGLTIEDRNNDKRFYLRMNNRDYHVNGFVGVGQISISFKEKAKGKDVEEINIISIHDFVDIARSSGGVTYR